MQPSNHDDLHHVSVESTSLRYCRQLTAQQGSYNDICPIYCVVYDIAWITQLVIILVVRTNAATHTYWVIMLSQVQWPGSHSPLNMSGFIGYEWDGCGILTASVSETNGIFTVCDRSEESNIVHMRHTQEIGTNCRRWAISTVLIFWPRHIHGI
jgi:hypothetical protein